LSSSNNSANGQNLCYQFSKKIIKSKVVCLNFYQFLSIFQFLWFLSLVSVAHGPPGNKQCPVADKNNSLIQMND
jgi:hypothetical protein